MLFILPRQLLGYPSNRSVRLEMLCDSTFLERLRRCWLWVSLNLSIRTPHAYRVYLGLLAMCYIPFLPPGFPRVCVP